MKLKGKSLPTQLCVLSPTYLRAFDGRNRQLIAFVVAQFMFLGIVLYLYQPVELSAITNNERDKNPGLPSLSELLKKSGSDKFSRHRYDHFYGRLLEPFRSLENFSMLEIGIQQANSLAFWNSYFLHPKLILGLAYGSDTTGVEELAGNLDKVQVVRGDQSKIETMDLLKKTGPFDIIVDDGSHVPAHMIFTFFHLWPSIRPGGAYVIEDLETNYWAEGKELYGYTFKGTGFGKSAETNAVEKLKQFVDILVKNQIGAKGLSIFPDDDQLCSIEFGKNLVALHKCSEYEMKYQPLFQAKAYDEELMKQWLTKVKSSNPVGFNGTMTV